MLIWYKCWADHGGGHQGHSEKYFSSSEPLAKDECESIWLDWANKNYYSNAIGDVEEVQTLPEKERQNQIRYYEQQIRNAERMLEELHEKQANGKTL